MKNTGTQTKSTHHAQSYDFIDIEAEPQHWGRGDWLHGRTLEILDYTGLNTDLLGTGSKVETLAVHHQLPPRNQTATAGRTSIDFVPESIVTKYK